MITFHTFSGAAYVPPPMLALPAVGANALVLPDELQVRSDVAFSGAITSSAAVLKLRKLTATAVFAADVPYYDVHAPAEFTNPRVWLRVSYRNRAAWFDLGAPWHGHVTTDGRVYVRQLGVAWDDGVTCNGGAPVADAKLEFFVVATVNGAERAVLLDTAVHDNYQIIEVPQPHTAHDILREASLPTVDFGTSRLEENDLLVPVHAFSSSESLSIPAGGNAIIELAALATANNNALTWARVTCGAAAITFKTYVEGYMPSGARVEWLPNVATLSSARSGMAGAKLGEFVYLAGGHTAANGATFEKISTLTWTRTALPHLPDKVAGAAMVAHSGKLWLFGGQRSGGASVTYNTLWVYDPVAASWASGPSLPTVWRHGFAVPVGDYIWVFGGMTTTSFVGLYRLHVPTLTWATFASGGVAAMANTAGSAAQDGSLFYFVAQNSYLYVIDLAAASPVATSIQAVTGGTTTGVTLGRAGARTMVLHSSSTTAGYAPRTYDLDSIASAPAEFTSDDLAGLTLVYDPTAISYEETPGQYSVVFAGGGGGNGSTVVNRVKATMTLGDVLTSGAASIRWNNKAYDMAMLTLVRSLTAPAGMVVLLPIRDTGGVLNIDVDYLAALPTMRPRYQEAAKLGEELAPRLFEVAICTAISLYRSGAYGVYIAAHMPNSAALRARSAGSMAELSKDGENFFPGALTVASQDELMVRITAAGKLDGSGAEVVTIFAKIGGS